MSQMSRKSILSVPLFEELKRRKRMTPDLEDLEGKYEHLVFIYDNYKRGLPLHKEYLSETKYLGSARTLESSYQLMCTPNAQLPILLSGGHLNTENRPNYHACKGEVYALTTQQLIRLDAVHDNHSMFESEVKYFILEDQESPFKVDPGTGKKPPLARQCYVYLGIPQVWEHCMLNFTTKSYYSSRTFWEWSNSEQRNMSRMN